MSNSEAIKQTISQALDGNSLRDDFLKMLMQISIKFKAYKSLRVVQVITQE